LTNASGDFPSLWKKVEEILASPENDGGWLTGLLPLVLELTGLSWAFLTELFTGDSDHYAILAECPQVAALDTRQSFNAGLAGLVHAKLAPLAIPDLNPRDELSAVFHPGDPLKKATSFYGWPLVYNHIPWGGLILVGSQGQTLTPDKTRFLECLVLRLAAQLQQEKLVGRVLELNGLDSQTGLPHRSHFLERFDRQIEIAMVQKRDLILAILGVSGLGRHAVAHGQSATRELLRSLSLLLLQNSLDSWEIGHVSYGIFAVSVPAKEEETLDKAILMFKRRLLDVFGQSGFSCHQSRVVCPQDGTKPEPLLEAALTSLAEAAA
jgi:GGDEF domain-containing protein